MSKDVDQLEGHLEGKEVSFQGSAAGQLQTPSKATVSVWPLPQHQQPHAEIAAVTGSAKAEPIGTTASREDLRTADARSVAGFVEDHAAAKVVRGGGHRHAKPQKQKLSERLLDVENQQEDEKRFLGFQERGS